MPNNISGFSQPFFGNLMQNNLNYSPGKVLSGIVLSVNKNNALILLEGLDVVAELKTNLVVGEKVSLRVESEMEDGRTMMKKLDSDSLGRELGSKEVKAILNYFGLKSSKMADEVVKAMLQAKVPVTGQNIRSLMDAAVKHNIKGEQLPVMAWLWSKGLPVTDQTVNSVYKILHDSGHQNSLLEILNSEADQNTRNSSLNSKLESLLFTNKEDSNMLFQKLLNLTRNLDLEYEKNITELLNRDSSVRLEAKNELSESLKSTLLELYKSEDSGLINKETVGRLLNNITGLQLLNLGQSQDADISTIFLQGWMSQGEDQITPFYIKYEEKNSEAAGTGDDDGINVLFSVTTENLGKIMCELIINREYLTCVFFVEGKNQKELIDRYFEFLRDRLETLPWEVVIYPAKVLSASDMDERWFSEVLKPDITRKNLDVKV